MALDNMLKMQVIARLLAGEQGSLIARTLKIPYVEVRAIEDELTNQDVNIAIDKLAAARANGAVIEVTEKSADGLKQAALALPAPTTNSTESDSEDAPGINTTLDKLNRLDDNAIKTAEILLEKIKSLAQSNVTPLDIKTMADTLTALRQSFFPSSNIHVSDNRTFVQTNKVSMFKDALKA